MPKVLRFAGVVGAVIGVIFLVVGLWQAATSIAFRSSAIKVGGTVVDVHGHYSCSGGTARKHGSARHCDYVYSPVVKFSTKAGRQITFTPDYSTSSKPSVGSEIEVLYPADDPQAARVANFADLWLLPVIFGGLGLVIGGLGSVVVVRWIRTARTRSWLEHSGQRVSARVQEIRPVKSVRINGRNPWRVSAGWQDPNTGRQHTFESDLIRDNPTEAIDGIGTIDVLVDPSDPGRRYWMDLGSRAIDT